MFYINLHCHSLQIHFSSTNQTLQSFLELGKLSVVNSSVGQLALTCPFSCDGFNIKLLTAVFAETLTFSQRLFLPMS